MHSNLKSPQSRPLTRPASLLALFLLASCASLTGTKTQPITLDPPKATGVSSSTAIGSAPLSTGFCDNARPIHWSVKMTDDQIRQIKAHNAVYHSLCGRK